MGVHHERPFYTASAVAGTERSSVDPEMIKGNNNSRDRHKLEHFRAASNDLHLNERGNAIIADVLMGIINKS